MEVRPRDCGAAQLPHTQSRSRYCPCQYQLPGATAGTAPAGVRIWPRVAPRLRFGAGASGDHWLGRYIALAPARPTPARSMRLGTVSSSIGWCGVTSRHFYRIRITTPCAMQDKAHSRFAPTSPSLGPRKAALLSCGFTPPYPSTLSGARLRWSTSTRRRKPDRRGVDFGTARGSVSVGKVSTLFEHSEPSTERVSRANRFWRRLKDAAFGK